MTTDELEGCLAALGHARKAVQRPAAEQLAVAARDDPTIRARVAALLASPDARTRWGAAYVLARLETVPLDAVAALLEALGSADGDVRWAAARILTAASLVSAEVAADVVRLLESSSPLQRKMALYCVRDLGGAVRVEPTLLARSLGDPDSAVRLAGLSASAALLPPTPDTADLLAPLVDDPDAGVRRAAAATLGRVGVRSAGVEERLLRASASGDAALARAAGEALSRLGAAGVSARRRPPPGPRE
jgi:HEAT repeat protein